MSIEVYVVLISLLFSALFSGVEIAFISANKLKLEIAKEDGLTNKLLSHITQNPSNFIATTLVGNTLSLSVYGVFMAKIIEPILTENLPISINNNLSIFLLQISISTALVLLTAEFMPKSLFLISPNKLLRFFTLPITIVYYILYPFVFLIVELSKIVITKVFRLNFSTESPAFGLTDLSHLVANSADNNEYVDNEVDTKILNNAIEFKTVKVRECMIPRTEMEAIDIEDGIDELLKAFNETGHSKILIYKESIDNILGYCESKQMFKKPENIKEILRALIIVPETMLANDLLVQFIQDKKHIALVVDEFGGTAGIVTMEDIIEEILGDIQDEHDEESLLEQVIDDSTYILSARHEIDYLNEKYNFNFQEGDYETIGGYLLSIFKNIPSENEIIETDFFIFEIIQTQNNRIETIRVSKKEK